MIRIISIITLLLLPGNGIEIKDQWLRPGAEKMATALYFNIENSGDLVDTLYAVESDISSMIQMHESYSQGDMMGMREIKELVIEPGSEISLEPGGNHIMVMKLKRDLNRGEKIKFLLHFKHAGEIPIIAEVKE